MELNGSVRERKHDDDTLRRASAIVGQNGGEACGRDSTTRTRDVVSRQLQDGVESSVGADAVVVAMASTS